MKLLEAINKKGSFRKFKTEVKKKLNKLKIKFFDPSNTLNYEMENIAAIISVSNIDFLKIINEKLFDKYSEVGNKYFDGIIIQNESGLSIIIFYPKNYIITLDENIFCNTLCFYIVDRFVKFGKENSIDTLININFGFYLYIELAVFMLFSKHFNKSLYELRIINFKNTLMQYKRNILQYSKNKNFNEGFDMKNINHIEMFSNIYYWSLRVISDVCKNEENLILCDIGTCLAVYPLTLKLIEKKDFLGINLKKIIASDIAKYWKVIKPEINFLKDVNDIQFEFKKINALKNNLKSLGDIVTCFHVLEHFYVTKDAYIALKELWKKTEKLLIINVPFDDELSNFWGHYSLFNQDILREWANSLEGGINIADDYKLKNNKTLTDFGFIIMKRN